MIRHRIQALAVIGLSVISVLTACGATAESPTPATSATPAATAAAGRSATPSVAFPLVPAFPSSTVAFSGTGPLAASMPFLLRAGSYRITWYSQAIGAADARTTWPLVGTIHDSAGSGPELPLLRVDMPIGGPQTGEASAGPFAEGTYILKVDADPLCNWTIQIHP